MKKLLLVVVLAIFLSPTVGYSSEANDAANMALYGTTDLNEILYSPRYQWQDDNNDTEEEQLRELRKQTRELEEINRKMRRKRK